LVINVVLVQELLAIQHGVLGGIEHGVEATQHGEWQDHVAVLTAHLHVAQPVICDAPDEVSDPLELALELLSCHAAVSGAINCTLGK
jgi:hypothetical protein